MRAARGQGTVVVAVDGGGTRTRCGIFDEHGSLLGTASSGPSNQNCAERQVVVASVRQAIEDALRSCGKGPEDVLVVSAALAGVEYDGAGAEEANAILVEAGWANCLIYGDVLAAHAGALGGESGVLVLAGTGSIAFAVAPDGRSSKAGGFGYLFGDEGSAFWIAREALKAASHADDGRGPATQLTAAFCRHLQIGEFSESLRFFYVDAPLAVTRLSQCSSLVNEVAEAGDTVARRVLFSAGDELARLAEVLLRRLPAPGTTIVTYHGAVLLHSRLVRESFESSLRTRLPSVLLRAPVGDPVLGAYLLAQAFLGKRKLYVSR